MIGPATGIKRTFYDSFARFLAAHGYGVLCYEHRGIGHSRSGAMPHSDASLISWGRIDMTAVLAKLQQCFPRTSYHLVGHSAGGQLVGLMDNAKELKSMFNVACSSGSLRNMTYPFKWQALFFMNCFIPLSNLLFGYTKSHWIGMGEPLPKEVAKQWRKWCNGEGYVQVALGETIKEHLYDELEMPSQWLYAVDDGIANHANVEDMIRVYSKIEATIVTLQPQTFGFDEIGHMKFFSSKKKVLWTYALDWLDANG